MVCCLAQYIKISAIIVIIIVESFNDSGELVLRNQVVSFAVGAGNFGGPRNGTQIIPCQQKPNRSPDVTLTHQTSVDQAAIFRLSGDPNPLHIDPSMAQMGGFDRPILHGLCTLGISVRLVLKAFGGYDTSLFKALKVSCWSSFSFEKKLCM